MPVATEPRPTITVEYLQAGPQPETAAPQAWFNGEIGGLPFSDVRPGEPVLLETPEGPVVPPAGTTLEVWDVPETMGANGVAMTYVDPDGVLRELRHNPGPDGRTQFPAIVQQRMQIIADTRARREEAALTEAAATAAAQRTADRLRTVGSYLRSSAGTVPRPQAAATSSREATRQAAAEPPAQSTARPDAGWRAAPATAARRVVAPEVRRHRREEPPLRTRIAAGAMAMLRTVGNAFNTVASQTPRRASGRHSAQFVRFA